MKLFFKHTAFDKLRDQLDEALKVRRKVDSVAMTPDEYADLLDDCRVRGMLTCPSYYYGSAELGEVALKTREFALVSKVTEPFTATRSPFIRISSIDKIYGIEIYVVPKEYCPV